VFHLLNCGCQDFPGAKKVGFSAFVSLFFRLQSLKSAVSWTDCLLIGGG
jgi:hypothetical protein